MEPLSYGTGIYKGAGSATDKHFPRSPSQLHLSGKTSQAVTRPNQSNEYTSPPMKSDSTCMLPKISSGAGNVGESHQHMDPQ